MRNFSLLIFLIPLTLKSQTQFSFSIEGLAGSTNMKNTSYIEEFADNDYCNYLFIKSVKNEEKYSLLFTGFSPSLSIKKNNIEVKIMSDFISTSSENFTTTTKGFGTLEHYDSSSLEVPICTENRPDFQEKRKFFNRFINNTNSF